MPNDIVQGLASILRLDTSSYVARRTRILLDLTSSPACFIWSAMDWKVHEDAWTASKCCTYRGNSLLGSSLYFRFATPSEQDHLLEKALDSIVCTLFLLRSVTTHVSNSSAPKPRFVPVWRSSSLLSFVAQQSKELKEDVCITLP
jgi:hypothetical protein